MKGNVASECTPILVISPNGLTSVYARVKAEGCPTTSNTASQELDTRDLAVSISETMNSVEDAAEDADEARIVLCISCIFVRRDSVRSIATILYDGPP